MSDAKGKVLDLIFGRWKSQILYAGVRLGVFDVLGNEARSTEDIARELQLDAGLLYRLLRALGSLDLLREGPERTFSLAPAGAVLQKDHPQTLRGVTLLEEGPEHYALWKRLTDMVRDGRQNGFVREFGTMSFQYAARNPGYGDVFDQAMSSYKTTSHHGRDWPGSLPRTPR